MIPDGYFDDLEIVLHSGKNGYGLIEIGGHSNEIRKQLAKIREEAPD